MLLTGYYGNFYYGYSLGPSPPSGADGAQPPAEPLDGFGFGHFFPAVASALYGGRYGVRLVLALEVFERQLNRFVTNLHSHPVFSEFILIFLK